MRFPRILLLTLVTLIATAAPAAGAPYGPARGHVWLGLAGRPAASAYRAATGRRPAVFQSFTMFGQNPGYVFLRAAAMHARPMVHISTAAGNGLPERITPRAIALGKGDHWLLDLQQRIAAVGGPVYVRPFAEMNAYWNAYSAYSAYGRRNAAHSTTWFKRAWRRLAVILRGGPGVDARLRAMHLPVTHRGSLPAAQVALVWCPQVAGAPDVAGNSPRAYWPGARWVDWVATDFYSRFPNFSGLNRFYSSFRGKPFAFGEWALWDRDDPSFVRRLFSWVRGHSRVRMLVYNQGARVGGPFDLGHFPASRAAIRAATRGARFR
ncbi:MAG: hypothetical protein QOK21_1554 [Solirubrobacteraceae bacterium]|jgi:hypothetical protein|nr:hypothetical protein [Solirubrobacteraceae bacterium]